MGEEAAGISGGDGLERRAGSGNEVAKRALRPAAQVLLDLAEGELDRVEIGE